MAGDPESLTAVKSNANSRVFKICGVVFSLACVSTIAYGSMDGSGADGGRRLQDCATDEKACPGGYSLMRDPTINCAFPSCPGGHGASPSVGHAAVAVPSSSSGGGMMGSGSTTDQPKNVGAIVGGTLAGAAAVGSAIAGAVFFKQHPDKMNNILHTVASTNMSFIEKMIPPTTTPRIGNASNMLFEKYETTYSTTPGGMSQGVLVGIASLGLFALSFLAITGFMYMHNRNCSDEAEGEDAGRKRNTYTSLSRDLECVE